MADNGSISHNLHETSNHLCKIDFLIKARDPVVAKKGPGITPGPFHNLLFALSFMLFSLPPGSAHTPVKVSDAGYITGRATGSPFPNDTRIICEQFDIRIILLILLLFNCGIFQFFTHDVAFRKSLRLIWVRQRPVRIERAVRIRI